MFDRVMKVYYEEGERPDELKTAKIEYTEDSITFFPLPTEEQQKSRKKLKRVGISLICCPLLIPFALFFFIFACILKLISLCFDAMTNKKKRCSLPVTAECFYITKEERSRHIKRNIYESYIAWISYFKYYYAGNYYYCDATETSLLSDKPVLGDHKEVFINPDKPSEYWSNQDNTAISISRFYLIAPLILIITIYVINLICTFVHPLIITISLPFILIILCRLINAYFNNKQNK